MLAANIKAVAGLCVAAVAVAAVSACGPEQPGAATGTATGAPTTTAAAAPGVKVDADGFPTPMCGLIGKDLVGSTFGLTMVSHEETKISCEYTSSSAAVGWYRYRIMPLENGGQSEFDSRSKSSARNPDFQKVQGPWVDGFYYRELGGGIGLVFKTSKWYVSTAIGGQQLTNGGANQNLAQMTTLGGALAKVLG